MKVDITFTIQKDYKEIVLSAEEAREVFEQLKQFFKEDTPPITYPTYPTPPWHVVPWTAPGGTGDPIPPMPWTITCSSETPRQ